MAMDLNKLSDTQLMILNAGNVNPDHNILPHNEKMKARGAILNGAIKKLEDGGLIARKIIAANEPGSTAENGERFTFILTKAALAALNGDESVEESNETSGRDINIAKNPATGNPTLSDAAAKLAAETAKSAKAAAKAVEKAAKAAERAEAKAAKDTARAEAKAARIAAKGDGGATTAGRTRKAPPTAEEIAADEAWRSIAKRNKGKVLYPVAGAKELREGNRRTEVLKLVQEHPNGISYEDALKSGAGSFDIYALVYYHLIEAKFVGATEAAAEPKSEEGPSDSETNETEDEAANEDMAAE